MTANPAHHLCGHREFLESLAAKSGEEGPISNGTFNEVPLCVLPTYAFKAQYQQSPSDTPGQSQRQSLTGQSHVDDTLGMLCVPDELDADEVYAEVAVQGLRVVKALHIKK